MTAQPSDILPTDLASAADAYDDALAVAAAGSPAHIEGIRHVLMWAADHPEALGAVREDAQRLTLNGGRHVHVPADQPMPVPTVPVHRWVFPYRDTPTE